MTPKHMKRNDNRLRAEIKKIVLEGGDLDSCYMYMPDESKNRIQKQYKYVMHDYQVQQYLSAKIDEKLNQANPVADEIIKSYQPEEPVIEQEESTEESINSIVIPEEIENSIPEEPVETEKKNVIHSKGNRLEPYKDEILEKFRSGVSMAALIKEYKCGFGTIHTLIHKYIPKEEADNIIKTAARNRAESARKKKDEIKKAKKEAENELVRVTLRNSVIIKAGLVSDRHKMPVDKFIFTNIDGDKVNNFNWLEKVAETWMKANLDYNRTTDKFNYGLMLYVTGLTSACAAVIKLCYKYNIPLVLMHYDDNPERELIYKPQYMNRESDIMAALDNHINKLYNRSNGNVFTYKCDYEQLLNSNDYYYIETKLDQNMTYVLAKDYQDTMNVFREESAKIYKTKTVGCVITIYQYINGEEKTVMTIKM